MHNWIHFILNFHFLLTSNFDLIIGGTNSHDIKSANFEASPPYIQDDFTWCVSGAKQIPRWKNIFYIPKDAQTYICGMVLLIMTLFGLYLFSSFEEKPLDFIYCMILTVQTMIGFTSIFEPKRILLRIHYALFLVVPFWLTQIFSAHLITFISRVLFEHQIATWTEIVDHNFRLAGDISILDNLRFQNEVKFAFIFKFN